MGGGPFRIRLTRPADAERLPAIERSAAEAFLALPDLAWVAAGEVEPVERHLALIERGAAWVGVDDEDAPVGFLDAEVMGDRLHVWELSVHRQTQGLGLGRALVRHAIRWARDRGLSALTLTTFRDVAWNEPFYRSLGFEALAPHDLTPDLVRLLAHEVRLGLPGDRRCAMKLPLR
jgi:GNAT superfamily N-acetyltransferase